MATIFDLEDRTLLFATMVRTFTKKLPRTTENIEDIKQLAGASASVGANYIEANESLGEKDKRMKIKISRKESKEARFFTRLVDTNQAKNLEDERSKIIQKPTELMNIFGAVLRKLG